MRYFTPELFAALNSQDEGAVEQAEQRWDAAQREYQDYFKSIEKKLPKALVKLCKTAPLHDGRIERPSRPFRSSWATDDQGEHSWVTLSIKQEHADFDLLYLDPIEPLWLTHPVDSAAFVDENVIWLYDEVNWLEEGTYSHEILFSNGNVLHVKFRGFKYVETPDVTDRVNAELETASRP
jgi:hypothetical protein